MKASLMSLHADQVAYKQDASADVSPLRLSNEGYMLALRVVPLDEIVPHEHYHGLRVAELAARLAAEGRLINPPLVVRHGEKYVLLDGATRVTALRQLGYRDVIVQVVDLVGQQVELTSWNHVVYGGNGTALLEVLRGVPGVTLTLITGDDSIRSSLPEDALAYLITAGGEAFLLEARPPVPRGSIAWFQLLNEVVECYGKWGRVERTLSSDVEALASQFPDMAALVIFPHFAPEVILQLAERGHTVPAGITRFVVPGRILRLNAPLEWLAMDEPLAVKQAWLDEFIREKLRRHHVRFYEEPVVLLDE